MDESMERSLSSDSSVREWTGEDEQEEHHSNPEQQNICGFCGAGFSSLRSVTRHIDDIHKSNSPLRKHICRFCGAKYTQQYQMTRHIRVRHELSGRERLPLADHQRRFSVRFPAITTPDSARSAKSRVTARSPKFKSAELPKPKPQPLRPASESREPKSDISLASQKFIPKREPQATQSNPTSNQGVIFHFFLEDEQHGAISQPLRNCQTMSSFFDEALAAWATLSEEQHQVRMVAVKVLVEDVGRPIVVLWRNKEGWERMMNTVRKQAAEKPTVLDVEVRCFQRGSKLGN